MIEFGWDEPSTRFLRSHIKEMEKMPFDGCVFHAEADESPAASTIAAESKPKAKRPNISWQGWGHRQFSESEFKAAMTDLEQTHSKKLSHNFLRFNVTPGDLDWFDNFETVMANAALCARIAHHGKCDGILFDIEQYDHPLFSYGKQRDTGAKGFGEYAKAARKRGAEIVNAFQKEFPGLTILMTFGYSLPLEELNASPANKLATISYGLLAPFLDGMFEAAKGRTTIVDGFEVSYGYKTPAEFQRGYELMTHDVLPIVGDTNRFKAVGRFGFGLWLDRDSHKHAWSTNDFSQNYYSPDSFRAAVAAAAEKSDKYVWIYSQAPRWWSEPDGKPGNLPKPYIQALQDVRKPVTR